MLNPEISTLEDLPEWILLAREVEPLFGPMAEDPGFLEGLRRAILCGDAFCVMNGGEEGRKRLQGGIVVSRTGNEVLWFAVARESRGQGIGKALLEKAVMNLDPARPMTVTTFDATVQEGVPARKVYRTYGFDDSRPGGLNPAGFPTVVMVRPVS
jgi:GNAT superfamily N-acetyltransferase